MNRHLLSIILILNCVITLSASNVFGAIPITPNASPEARSLLNYLYSVYGKKTLSGQMWAPWAKSDEIEKVYEITGKYPALRGLDYINERANKRENQLAVEWWKSGGIPTIMWHWGAPSIGEGYENSKKEINIDRCFEPGTEEFKAMWSDLKRIADHLTELRDANVPILWRPMHECEGNWFWYGKGGSDRFVKLWRTMFDYFTKERKLNNLIWVLCHTGEPSAAWDPGKAYYDLAGGDTYGKGIQAALFNKLKTIHGETMPIPYHECGTLPDPDECFKNGITWSWWMLWHTNHLDNHNPDELKRIYNHDLVITRDELPNIMDFLAKDGVGQIIYFAQTQPIHINVDLNREKGAMKPIWAWFGYDEPNYTYMKDGKKLLTELSALSPVPVYVRAHNLMTTGDGTPALKWGSTNMYTEDKDGNPIYNWCIIDSIFDTYINLKMKPLAQIGFMPEALSTNPQPYQHNWLPGKPYKTILTGWAYPPKDYKKWSELIYQWVAHCVERYGKTEVESWYWQLWNEPNGDYLISPDRIKEYCIMYDYASDAVKRALPNARMGGPHTHGGGARFVRSFIQHCLNDTNAATGKIGAPLDFVAFHAKGSPRVVNGVVRMGMMNQLRNINDNLEVVASFPDTKKMPVIIGESDPEGCAACGMQTNPENAYRNGTMYSSYTAASIARIYDLNDYYETNLIGAVNWSFEFENQPWFFGFRDLATNGVDKPVLNVFRMFGMMSGQRVEVSGNLAYDFKSIRDSSVRKTQTDVNALAAKDKGKVTIMVWNYHDDDLQGEGSPVSINVKGLKSGKATLCHYRIDAQHSNSYEVWKKMGSPQQPTEKEYTILEKSGQLEFLSKAKKVNIKNSELTVNFQLPRQAVSFLKIEYQNEER